MELTKCPRCNEPLLQRVTIDKDKRVVWKECTCGFTLDPALPKRFDDWEGRIKSPASR